MGPCVRVAPAGATRTSFGTSLASFALFAFNLFELGLGQSRWYHSTFVWQLGKNWRSSQRGPAGFDPSIGRDVDFSMAYGLLQIAEPKTRYRAARHQTAKIDQPQKVVEIGFQNLSFGYGLKQAKR